MLFKASVPGSLFLLGEHAVLHGGHAIVCAVNQRMTVSLSPRQDHIITIFSSLGKIETDLFHLNIQKPFHFILAVLKKYQKKMKYGCDIMIKSEFSDTVGLASSAAVTVGTMAVLFRWLRISFTEVTLIKAARHIIRQVQGMGSGADIAACVLGGVVAYRATPFFVKKFSNSFPLRVIYSGKKTPTADVIRYVQEKFFSESILYQKICDAIQACSLSGIQALREKNIEKLAKLMTIQQGLMDALGVNTIELQKIIDELRQHKNVLGAKISGSGLGDCIVAIGKKKFSKKYITALSFTQPIFCKIDFDGLCYE